MFDAIKPLLLDGDNEPAVDEQRGGRIVIHCIDSKNVHWPTFARMISSAPAIVARATSIAVSALFTTTITPAATCPPPKDHNIAFDAVYGSFSDRGRKTQMASKWWRRRSRATSLGSARRSGFRCDPEVA
jgi:hypothetical protein